MAKRTVVALFLLAVLLPIILFSEIGFFVVIAFFLTVSSWEYVHMFRAAKAEPSQWVVVGGTFLLLVVRTVRYNFGGVLPVGLVSSADEISAGTLALLVLIAMTVHLYAYERGRDQAALDFAVTVGGFIYLGWVGAYLIDLRNLPNGSWWLMLVLPSVWLADTGAYVLGSKYGKHKMTPRLSPKKSWEGYWVGVFTGTLGGAFFAWAFNVNTTLFGQSLLGPLTITPWDGALLGLVLSVVTTLGDLGESMFKRQGGIKDSGHVIPGHGGAFDRIDSWIWAGV
ncbi:MAG: phosphatidate cytidylyltransferase, partial [Chloroflexota bacterium]